MTWRDADRVDERKALAIKPATQMQQRIPHRDDRVKNRNDETKANLPPEPTAILDWII